MPDFEIVADPDPDLDRFLDLLSRVEEERRQERRKDRHKPRSGDRHKPRSGDWHKSRAVNNRPFIVVDGEGGGKDELGRQNYLLMGAAGIDGTYYQLFEDNRPLTTRECLEFVLALPSTEAATLCSFYFSYDVTHILRDVPDDRIERLLSPKPAQSSRYTHWQQYFLEHVPGQFFRVAKACPIRGKPLKGAARTIHDSGRLFQSPFIEILEKWQVADPESLAFLEKLGTTEIFHKNNFRYK